MTRWETWGYVVLAFVSCALHYGVPTVSAGLFDIAAALAVRSLLRLLTRRLDPSSTGRAALTIHPHHPCGGDGGARPAARATTATTNTNTTLHSLALPLLTGNRTPAVAHRPACPGPVAPLGIEKGFASRRAPR